jgi:ribulose-bisphosphate carboxylase large chain
MKYIDFVDLSYEPRSTDAVCEFYIETDTVSLKEAAGGVAAESSIGTWTELSTLKRYVEKLHATVFDIRGNDVKISYPLELFEDGNMPNILSSVAGNVFGLGALNNLRLNDIVLPQRLVRSFKGPRYGIEGVRRLLKVEKRPIVGTIIKPKLGLNTRDHADVAYEAWLGGCDFVKDDENLASQSFNRFDERLRETLRIRDLAEKETGERKMYLVNVTAETQEMLRRARSVCEAGGEYAMIDVLTCGYAGVQTLRNQDLGLVLHAHRAGHAAFTRNIKHGVSMRVISKIMRIIGLDQLHVGAGVGKMSETREEVLSNVESLKEEIFGLKRVLPVASGGLYPALVPSLLEIFGNDVVIQAGGGIHGHTGGTLDGAKAMRQAVEAVEDGKTLAESAAQHKELRSALEKWPN